MRIIREGSERHIRKVDRKEERAKRKADERYKAAEIATFKCPRCGCKFAAGRDEYYITDTTLTHNVAPLSAAAMDCPYCGKMLSTTLSIRLRAVTRDEILKGARYCREKVCCGESVLYC